MNRIVVRWMGVRCGRANDIAVHAAVDTMKIGCASLLQRSARADTMKFGCAIAYGQELSGFVFDFEAIC